MIAVICDGCKKTVAAEGGRPPDAWFVVTTGFFNTSQYCSAACAVIALTDHLTTQQKPLLQEPV